jgi:hypothetical protein
MQGDCGVGAWLIVEVLGRVAYSSIFLQPGGFLEPKDGHP